MLHRLRLAQKGEYREQFNPARLADAIAMCRHDWDHFKGSKASMPADGSRQWLPHQLAAALQRCGRRPRAVPQESVLSAESLNAAGTDNLAVGPRPQPMTQRAHALGASCHFRRSEDVQVVVTGRCGPRTLQEFLTHPVAAGACVVTRPAPRSPVGRASRHLQNLPFWVWRILRVFDPGAALPPNSKHLAAAVQPTYEAHLYCTKTAGNMSGPWKPCWDAQDEVIFLYTPEEKANKKARKEEVPVLSSGSSGSAGAPAAAAKAAAAGGGSEPPVQRIVHVPLVAFLRPNNLIGGGFMLSVAGRIPNFVRDHTQSVVAAVAPTD